MYETSVLEELVAKYPEIDKFIDTHKFQIFGQFKYICKNFDLFYFIMEVLFKNNAVLNYDETLFIEKFGIDAYRDLFYLNTVYLIKNIIEKNFKDKDIRYKDLSNSKLEYFAVSLKNDFIFLYLNKSDIVNTVGFVYSENTKEYLDVILNYIGYFKRFNITKPHEIKSKKVNLKVQFCRV